LLLYGTLYTTSSAFLHGHGGELPYLVGLTGDKGLPIDPWPSQVGFEMSLLSIHETFRVDISRAAAVLGVDAGDPPVSAEFDRRRTKAMSST